MKGLLSLIILIWFAYLFDSFVDGVTGKTDPDNQKIEYNRQYESAYITNRNITSIYQEFVDTNSNILIFIIFIIFSIIVNIFDDPSKTSSDPVNDERWDKLNKEKAEKIKQRRQKLKQDELKKDQDTPDLQQQVLKIKQDIEKQVLKVKKDIKEDLKFKLPIEKQQELKKVKELKRQLTKDELEIQEKPWLIIINHHIQELSTKERQLVINKGYNLKDTKKWEAEKLFFINNVIKPNIGLFDNELNSISMDIETTIIQYRNKNHNAAGYSDDIDPYEYEHFCAKSLKQAGWDAEATVATGDQGADVIATKLGKKIILQCKKWKGSVGNKAVQEVYTATGFHKANVGIVVTNSTYTKSAEEAAKEIGVLLLHHDDLSEIDKILAQTNI